MTDNEIIEQYSHLFQGRYDAHGSWSGGKLDGPPNFAQHLADGPHVGVYCVLDDNTCWWGCVDIDGKDMPLDCDTCNNTRKLDDLDNDGATISCDYCLWDWDAMWEIAGNLVEALNYKNCTAHTERTTNGIHVWTFADSPVPAAIMRRALMAACTVIGYDPKEVNPKQEEVNPDKPYGNYVRLPYYGALKEQPKDRFVLDEDGPMTLDQFVQAGQGSRNSLEVYSSMADLYTPPAVTAVDVDTSASDISMLVPILPTVVRAIYEDGPLNGDRSWALMKSAVIMRDEGWQAQGMYQVLDAIDMRLGKFVGREDREQQLLAIIEKVLP